MLIAYEETAGFKIVDAPTGETQVPLRPIEKLYKARQILAWAADQRSDMKWKIVGAGPYGVHGIEE